MEASESDASQSEEELHFDQAPEEREHWSDMMANHSDDDNDRDDFLLSDADRGKLTSIAGLSGGVCHPWSSLPFPLSRFFLSKLCTSLSSVLYAIFVSCAAGSSGRRL